MCIGIDGKEAFKAIQAHCLAKEGAVEEYPWGHFAWKVKRKLFAVGTENESRVTVKSTLEKQQALVLHPNIEVASHVGRFGWVTITADSQDVLDLALELIDVSYDSVRRKRER